MTFQYFKQLLLSMIDVRVISSLRDERLSSAVPAFSILRSEVLDEVVRSGHCRSAAARAESEGAISRCIVSVCVYYVSRFFAPLERKHFVHLHFYLALMCAQMDFIINCAHTLCAEGSSHCVAQSFSHPGANFALATIE